MTMVSRMIPFFRSLEPIQTEFSRIQESERSVAISFDQQDHPT